MNTTGEHYCGECPFFKYEDMDGFGLCSLRERVQRCEDMCGFLTPDFDMTMTRVQTIKVLHTAQKWRRGGKQRMLPPWLFELAIDSAIRELRRIRHEKD